MLIAFFMSKTTINHSKREINSISKCSGLNLVRRSESKNLCILKLRSASTVVTGAYLKLTTSDGLYPSEFPLPLFHLQELQKISLMFLDRGFFQLLF